jgi:phenylacetate-CoA ligase
MGLRAWVYSRFMLGEAARVSEQYYREILAFDAGRPNAALAQMLQHASTHVPFYRQMRLPDAQLESFPIISKHEVRGAFNSLIADGTDRAACKEVHTSGSTGRPLVVLQDRDAHEWVRATELYFYRNMLGIDPISIPMVVFWASAPAIWGQKRDVRKRFQLWLTQTSLLGASRFTPEEMRGAIETINWRKPVVIKGYTSPLYEVAKYSRANNLRIHRPRFVYTCAETLHDYMRATIEEVFGCRAHDFYGTRETGPIAAECTAGRLHLMEFHTHTELLDGGSDLQREEKRPVLTTLRNRAMPLVRYDAGDAVRPSEGACPCGNALPTIAGISGRLMDYFVTPDGSLVWGGYYNRLLYTQGWISDYQVEQTALDEVVITFVSHPAPTDAQKRVVEEKVRLVMGEDCRVVWKHVPSLPPMPMGKRLYTVSHIRPR